MNYDDGYVNNVSVDRTEVSEKAVNNLQQQDDVNFPFHYTYGIIECIEAMEAMLTPEEFRGYLKGCAFKYLWRERQKGNAKKDINKAKWYINKLEQHTNE